MAGSDVENLKEAIRQEEQAVAGYLQWADETGDPALEEMFRQFSKNESWHLAALREKLDELA